MTVTERALGTTVFYEYHCAQSHDSGDAELWYRSHQEAIVLAVAEPGFGDTPEERGDNGQPTVYRIRFGDGYEDDAFEDELLDSASLANPSFGPPSDEEIRKARLTA